MMEQEDDRSAARSEATIRPEHVKFVIDNGNGTSTLTLKNGMRHILPSASAAKIAEVLNNEVRAIDGKIEAFQRIPENIRRAAEKTLRIKS
jgi:hypothetical protein